MKNSYSVSLKRLTTVEEYTTVTVYAEDEFEANERAVDLEAGGGKDDSGHYIDWEWGDTVDTSAVTVEDTDLIEENVCGEEEEDSDELFNVEAVIGGLTITDTDLLNYYKAGDEHLDKDTLVGRIADRKRAAR